MLKYVNYNIVFQEIPDEVTLALNLSNCPNRCKGCHSAWLQEDTGEELSEETLSSLLDVYGGKITCVCFMGGDASPREVEQMALFLRKQEAMAVKVGWYSGRDELPSGFNINVFDYIKLGAYRQEVGGLQSPSTNQRMFRVQDGKMDDITKRFWPCKS